VGEERAKTVGNEKRIDEEDATSASGSENILP